MVKALENSKISGSERNTMDSTTKKLAMIDTHGARCSKHVEFISQNVFIN